MRRPGSPHRSRHIDPLTAPHSGREPHVEGAAVNIGSVPHAHPCTQRPAASCSMHSRAREKSISYATSDTSRSPDRIHPLRRAASPPALRFSSIYAREECFSSPPPCTHARSCSVHSRERRVWVIRRAIPRDPPTPAPHRITAGTPSLHLCQHAAAASGRTR